MKAFLLYPDRDFDLDAPLPPQADALVQDLELDTLFVAMAGADPFLSEVCPRIVLRSLDDPQTITYRQAILRDCLDHTEVVREIYDLTVETLQAARKMWRGTMPDSLLHTSVSALELYVGTLERLRQLSDDHAAAFRSDGFTRLFGMLVAELSGDYFAEIADHLARLRFRTGVLISAHLGPGNKGTGHVLRRSPEVRQSWLERLVARDRSPYSFRIAERDEAGARALGELRARGIMLVANALAQSADHIQSFLRMLQRELAFYLGCVNLHRRLEAKGEPTCFPNAVASGARAFGVRGLYDVSLSLRQDARVVGNDVDGDGVSLVAITGANQGGKSTFLRSVGLAQVLMQCGMFVPATAMRAEVCRGLFTHFKREEDPTMKSGKLDEELGRMSTIADAISAHSLVLFNESFAATNEREGSELARQVVHALLEAQVRVFFVTHLFDFADSMFQELAGERLFLRAERSPDGRRTLRVVEGEPLPTSYGKDLYREIFEPGSGPASSASVEAVVGTGGVDGE